MDQTQGQNKTPVRQLQTTPPKSLAPSRQRQPGPGSRPILAGARSQTPATPRHSADTPPARRRHLPYLRRVAVGGSGTEPMGGSARA
jgi:hypothetical protein